MKSPIRWVIIVVALVGVAAIFYQWWQKEHRPPQLEPAARSETPPPAPEVKAEPQIRHPIAEGGSEATPLPTLADSDAALQESLAGVVGQKPLAEFFHPDGMIRRMVATVDNLPREKVALRLMPIKPVAGKFLVRDEGGSIVINPDNSARYTPYVQLAELVDAKKLVAVYVRFYPLFQQAYKDLGYPKGYFNDRLVEVIDHLLAAPDARGPVKLTRERVVTYQFADPKLEALSAGQKIMLRMGSDNATRIKAKLKEIRAELLSKASRQ